MAPARAELLARLSGGRLGWAVRQGQTADWGADREALFQEWHQLLRGNRSARFALAQKKSADREEARKILQVWESFSHDLLLGTLSGDAQVTNIDFQNPLRELAAGVSPARARKWLWALRRAEEQIDRNANVRLALEAAFLDAPAL
jgi:DNA polymerase-3 subunit delta'